MPGIGAAAVTVQSSRQTCLLDHDIDDPVPDHDDLPRRLALHGAQHRRLRESDRARFLLAGIDGQDDGSTFLAVHLYGEHHRLVRSEEHTSDPVTNAHLVCRLLLEKKKKKKKKQYSYK